MNSPEDHLNTWELDTWNWFGYTLSPSSHLVHLFPSLLLLSLGGM